MKMDLEIGLGHGLNMKNSALNLFNNKQSRKIYSIFKTKDEVLIGFSPNNLRVPWSQENRMFR